MLRNTKTLSQLRGHVHRPPHGEIAEAAYFQGKNTNCHNAELNWNMAENTLVRRKIEEGKRDLEIVHRTNLQKFLM